MSDDWRKGWAERLRAEAKKFAAYAAMQRKEATRFRKERRFLEALKADIAAREYRESRDQCLADAKRIAAGGPL